MTREKFESYGKFDTAMYRLQDEMLAKLDGKVVLFTSDRIANMICNFVEIRYWEPVIFYATLLDNATANCWFYRKSKLEYIELNSADDVERAIGFDNNEL